MCIKKVACFLLFDFFGGGERGKKLQRHLTNFLLGQHHLIGICECLDARVLFISQLREKWSSRQPLVSFLDMLSPGLDAMTWNPRDSMYPWMWFLIRSPHIFLNLINQPRGRMVIEMYCGLLLFINSNLILLQLMLPISLTLQASSFAQHLLPIVSLFSWPQRIPVTRHSMFILGGDYSLFPRVRLLQKISSLAQLLPFQSLPQILDPSLRFLFLSSFLSRWRILLFFFF